MEVYMCGYCTKEVGDILKHGCFKFYEESIYDIVVNDENIITMEPKHLEPVVTENVDEIIINLVRERRALFDNSIPVIERTKLKKNVLWEEICEALRNHNYKLTTRRGKKADQHCELTKAVLDFIKEPVSQTSPELTGVDGFLIRLVESLKRLPYRKRCQLEINILQMVYDYENE
ncbi:hypothetical protein NQ318_000193 [Aromia moschata]|uniref:MADF domain-containing protein n=1 Tax=Aromia moschata TaxID=1265417 RepID=A0AAV8YKI6_9CUCU|nr:hypothetical protein NQ318_000193 [Aromia moschata]